MNKRTKAQQIVTVGDARDEKRLADAIMFAKWDARAAKPEQPQVISNLDPRIGILVRNGRTVYYVTLDGQHIEGTLESLNVRLAQKDGAL